MNLEIEKIIQVISDNTLTDLDELKSIAQVMSDYMIENSLNISTIFNEVLDYEYCLDKKEKILVSLFIMQKNNISLESLVY